MEFVGERDVQILQWHVYYYVRYRGKNMTTGGIPVLGEGGFPGAC